MNNRPYLPRPQQGRDAASSGSRRFMLVWSFLLAAVWAWCFLTWPDLANAKPVEVSTTHPHQHLAPPAGPYGPWNPEHATRVAALLNEPAELECLAVTVYFEARGEPVEGQMAVAQVILARVEDPGYPDTICGVVKEARRPGLYQCQFTAWCDALSETPRDMDSYRRILGLSLMAMLVGPPPHAPTHYHAHYVQPHWPELAEVSRVGGHIFYR